MDAAFFNEKILKRLERSRCEFAIKAPFWPWLGLKELVAGAQVDGTESVTESMASPSNTSSSPGISPSGL